MLTLLVAALLLGSPARAAEPVLVELKAAADHLKDQRWLFIDCRDREAYAAGHVPGAVSLEPRNCRLSMRFETLPADAAKTSGRPRSVAALEKLLGAAGVSGGEKVVIYAAAGGGQGPVVAGEAFWTLEWLGHPSVHLLNGGFEAWKAAGLPVETATASRPAAVFAAKPDPKLLSGFDEVASAAGGGPGQLLDARTVEEYDGRWIRARRGGHIPRALNVPFSITYDELGRFDLAKLKKLYGPLDPNKRTIAYCQYGFRSALAYTELRALGFSNVTNYLESWQEYAHRIDHPVENETWPELSGGGRVDPREIAKPAAASEKKDR